MTRFEQSVAARDGAMRVLAGGGRQLVKRLRSLDEEERRAVVGLVAITQAVASASRTLVRPNEQIASALFEEVASLSPEVGDALHLGAIGGECLEESLAYATSVSRCLKAGKTAAECEKEAVGEAVSEITCVMKQFHFLREVLRELLGLRLPPWPRPPF